MINGRSANALTNTNMQNNPFDVGPEQWKPSINGVKIFGERHTGTNAVQRFVELNFNTCCFHYEILGWKHRKAPRLEEWRKTSVETTLFIFTVRNPYSWLQAMHKEPYAFHQQYLKDLSFDEFLRASIEEYENILGMWSEKYWSYLRMSEEVPHSMFVKIEAFNDDQHALYRRLEKLLDSKGKFIPFEKYVNGYGEKIASLANSLAIPQLPQESLRYIASKIDRRLLVEFSYPLI